MSEPSVIETPVSPDFTNLINVADDRLGAKALFASDEFFAVTGYFSQIWLRKLIVGCFIDSWQVVKFAVVLFAKNP